MSWLATSNSRQRNRTHVLIERCQFLMFRYREAKFNAGSRTGGRDTFLCLDMHMVLYALLLANQIMELANESIQLSALQYGPTAIW